MMNVHLRINDATTGQPIPVRLRITGLTGEHYMPLGRLAEFSTMKGEDVGRQVLLDSERWAFLDGPCEIPLPANLPLRIQALHGPAYWPINREITLGPGQMAIRLEMQPLPNWSQDWSSADGRCHFLTPHAALLEAAAEDLDCVNLLVQSRRYLSQDANTYPSLANLEAFSGQRPAVENAGRSVTVNTLNTHAILGQLALLHCHRVVYPLSFGPPDDPDDWSLADWCNQCHRKKGLVLWANPWKLDGSLPGGEALIQLILGQVDALEFDGRPRKVPFLPLWYRLLNAGFGVPILASSSKDSNQSVLGWPRTFARRPDPASHWIESFRTGPSFVTNGPMLKLELTPDAKQAQVVAESVTRFDRVELVVQGRAVANQAAEEVDGLWQATLVQNLSVAHTSWIAARIVAQTPSPFAPKQQLFAHTNPVWVEQASEAAVPQEALEFLRKSVQQTRDWLDELGQFTQERRKLQHLERCDQALAILKKRAGS